MLVDDKQQIVFAHETPSWSGLRLRELDKVKDLFNSENDVLITPSEFAHPQLKSISGIEAPVLIHKLQRLDESFQAYLIEPIPELLPLKNQYNFFYLLVLFTSLLLVWALLASLVFTRRSQLDRRDIQRKNHELVLANEQLKRQAETDFLTGCINRRQFEKILREHIASAQSSTQFCLALFDVDHFKRVNDCWGHDFGDKALRHISGFVQQHITMTDMLSRIGGEEFTIIMPNTTLDNARARLEEIRTELAITPLIDKEIAEPVTLTISIGLTHLLPNDNASRILQRADHAMYHAKENGRNQIYVL